jgi:hypothetical protein
MSPPLASSTFHDFVNKGQIVPLKEIRGFYLLIESLESFQEKAAYGAGALDAQEELEAESKTGAE